MEFIRGSLWPVVTRVFPPPSRLLDSWDDLDGRAVRRGGAEHHGHQRPYPHPDHHGESDKRGVGRGGPEISMKV